MNNYLQKIKNLIDYIKIHVVMVIILTILIKLWLFYKIKWELVL
jgi:hypothetical protein